jgi:hypothetical protein
MIGRSTLRAISRTIVSENTPPTIERPIKSRKTMVGDRDAMGIAGRAVENLFPAPEWRLGIDNPVLSAELLEEVAPEIFRLSCS